MAGLQDIEIKHLVALVAVSEEGTFAKAATRLGYTQSAVSQQIAGLERAVGAPVFDRPGGPRPVELTPLGRMLLDHACDLLKRLEVTRDEVDRFTRGESGRLVVGTFQSVSNTILPMIVGRLRDEAPEADIRLVESYEKELFPEALLRNELDVAFTFDDDWPGLVTEILFEDPYLVVTAKGAAPRGAPFPTVELTGRSLVGYQLNSCQRDIENKLRGIIDGDLDYVFRTDDNQAVVAMVRAGMGAAVVPLLAVDTRDESVSFHPLDPPIPARRVGLSWRDGRTQSLLAQRFVQLAREVCQDNAGRLTPA